MYTYGEYNLGTEAPVAGKRAYAQLEAGRHTRFLTMLVAATLQITVAATAVINGGSVLAAFDDLGVNEAGRDQMFGDPRLWSFFSELHRPSAGTSTRLTSVGVQTVQLREQLLIPFENPYSVVPREVALREADVKKALRLFYSLNGTNNGIARIVNGGTATLTALSVSAQQHTDEHELVLPAFAPRAEMISLKIPQAGKYEVLLPASDYIRGLTILQDTATLGYQSDIITDIQLKGDRNWFIGNAGPVPYEDFARRQEFEYGGNVFAAVNKALVHVNFQKYGRLSKILSPAQDTGLKLIFTAAPSVVAGAGASEIKILVHKLERDQRTGPDGRRVTSPALDFPV